MVRGIARGIWGSHQDGGPSDLLFEESLGERVQLGLVLGEHRDGTAVRLGDGRLGLAVDETRRRLREGLVQRVVVRLEGERADGAREAEVGHLWPRAVGG